MKAGVVAAIAALAVAAGTASASVSIPQTAIPVSATGEDVFDPQVAVDPAGNATYAWVTDNAGGFKVIQARRVNADGSQGPIHALSIPTENASSPDVDASPFDNSAVVVWQEFQGGDPDRQIRSARVLPDGGLGTILTASDTGNDSVDPSVGIGATGKALVAWVDLAGDDEIKARIRDDADVQDSIETVAEQGTADYDDPQVAVSLGSSSTVIVYRGENGPFDQIAYRRRNSFGYNGPAGGIEIATGASGASLDQPDVAVNSETDAVATWREDTGATTQTRARRIEGTQDTPTAPIKDLSDPDQNADQPQVAIDDFGTAYLTWRRSNGANTVAQERTLSKQSVLGTTENLAGGGGVNADQPQVATDAAGSVTFVYRLGAPLIQTRALIGGALTPPQDLATTGSNTEPRIDSNLDGARWGAYRSDTAGDDQAFGFFDPTAPSLAQAQVPVVNPPAVVPPVTRKRCKKGKKLKKGKCVKKKRKRKK